MAKYNKSKINPLEFFRKSREDKMKKMYGGSSMMNYQNGGNVGTMSSRKSIDSESILSSRTKTDKPLSEMTKSEKEERARQMNADQAKISDNKKRRYANPQRGARGGRSNTGGKKQSRIRSKQDFSEGCVKGNNCD